MAGKFELYQDKSGNWRFRLKAGNGQVIAVGEAYESKTAVMNGIESIRSNAAAAQLVDMSDGTESAAKPSAMAASRAKSSGMAASAAKPSGMAASGAKSAGMEMPATGKPAGMEMPSGKPSGMAAPTAER